MFSYEYCKNFIKNTYFEEHGYICFANPSPSNVAFHTENSHLNCFAKQITGFCMKCNTGLKWFRLKNIHHNVWFTTIVSILITLNKTSVIMKMLKVKHNTINHPAGIYLFTVNNGARAMYEISSKLTLKTPRQCQWHSSDVNIVKQISHYFGVFIIASKKWILALSISWISSNINKNKVIEKCYIKTQSIQNKKIHVITG